jgi:hypothetical protein
LEGSSLVFARSIERHSAVLGPKECYYVSRDGLSDFGLRVIWRRSRVSVA